MPGSRVLAGSLIVVLAASAASAAILNATTKKLSWGTTFTVNGTDFGKRPTAWLEINEHRIPLRVAKGATDTQFTAKLAAFPRRVYGVGEMKVKPAGRHGTFTLAGVSIELPAPADVSPLSGPAGTPVTITGSYFGTKKGKVSFGSIQGRVTTWSDTQIVVVVPPGVPAERVFVDVSNKAGHTAAPPTFDVTQ